jgi:GntR family transcriptional repressor for pyruvate dehydrogenase complex
MTESTATGPVAGTGADGQEPGAFTRIERVSVKELALTQIKRYINSGMVEPGQRLPSERDLAQRLGVARNSVREALKVLEAVGLVESRVGGGTYVASGSRAAADPTLGLGLSSLGGTVIEILEARQVIEGEAARLAAERVTETELHGLEAALSGMEEAANFHDYFAADMEFHRLIGQATHNAIVSGIVSSLIGALGEALHATHGDQLPTAAESNATHRQVFEAMARRDGAGTAESMRRHLRFSTELWRALVVLGTAERSQAGETARDHGEPRP